MIDKFIHVFFAKLSEVIKNDDFFDIVDNALAVFFLAS